MRDVASIATPTVSPATLNAAPEPEFVPPSRYTFPLDWNFPIVP